MTTFPLTCAREMTIRPGTHPIRTIQTQSGASRTRLFGSLPTGATLTDAVLLHKLRGGRGR